MMKAQTKRLRKVYAEFESSEGIAALVGELDSLRAAYGDATQQFGFEEQVAMVKLEDLRLICFDFISG
jgi:hypothetical protein